MDVLFLSVSDIKNAIYLREGSKNLLKTDFGTGDVIALCGKLENAKNTKYGPRLWINDGKTIAVTVGTFNRNVKIDASNIVKKFAMNLNSNKNKNTHKPSNKHTDHTDESNTDELNTDEIYVLIYGNPYEQDQIYINVNHENCVIIVEKKTFEEFHELREIATMYLRHKSGSDVCGAKELSADTKGNRVAGIRSGMETTRERETREPPREVETIETHREMEVIETPGDRETIKPPCKNGTEQMTGVQEPSDSEIIRWVKSMQGECGAKIDDVLESVDTTLKTFVEAKIYELLESGEFYEPRPRIIKIID